MSSSSLVLPDPLVAAVLSFLPFEKRLCLAKASEPVLDSLTQDWDRISSFPKGSYLRNTFSHEIQANESNAAKIERVKQVRTKALRFIIRMNEILARSRPNYRTDIGWQEGGSLFELTYNQIDSTGLRIVHMCREDELIGAIYAIQRIRRDIAFPLPQRGKPRETAAKIREWIEGSGNDLRIAQEMASIRDAHLFFVQSIPRELIQFPNISTRFLFKNIHQQGKMGVLLNSDREIEEGLLSEILLYALQENWFAMLQSVILKKKRPISPDCLRVIFLKAKEMKCQRLHLCIEEMHPQLVLDIEKQPKVVERAPPTKKRFLWLFPWSR